MDGTPKNPKTNYDRLQAAERAMRGMLSASFGEGIGGEFIEPVEIEPSDNRELNLGSGNSVLEQAYAQPSIDVMPGVEINPETSSNLEAEAPDKLLADEDSGLVEMTSPESVGEEPVQDSVSLQVNATEGEPDLSSSHFQANVWPTDLGSDAAAATILPIQVGTQGQLSGKQESPAFKTGPQLVHPESDLPSSSAFKTGPQLQQPAQAPQDQSAAFKNRPQEFGGEQKMGAKREQAKAEQMPHDKARAERGLPTLDNLPDLFAAQPGQNAETAQGTETMSMAMDAEAAVDFATTMMLESVGRIVTAIRMLGERVNELTSSLDAEGSDDHEL